MAKRAWTHWSRVGRRVYSGARDPEVADPVQNARVVGRDRNGAVARELWSAGSHVASYQALVVRPNLVEVDSRAAMRRAEHFSMASPQRRCPFPECPSHRDPRPAKIVRHGFMKSRSGARIRLLCRSCDRTFCSLRGSAYDRLQHLARPSIGSCNSSPRACRPRRWLDPSLSAAPHFSRQPERSRRACSPGRWQAAT